MPEKQTKEEPKPMIIKRMVKHVFTPDDRMQLTDIMLGAMDAKTSREDEFQAVKDSYKAKISEAESQVTSLAATLRAGFEMRTKDCAVRFLPDKKKEITDLETGELVAVEDMTPDDLQIELLQAEAEFECKEEIAFCQAGDDKGVIVVGRLKNKWYSAIRVKIGSHSLQERLDSEQRAFKVRFDAVNIAAKRAQDWLESNFGKDNAKGFVEPLGKAVESQKERLE